MLEMLLRLLNNPFWLLPEKLKINLISNIIYNCTDPVQSTTIGGGR